MDKKVFLEAIQAVKTLSKRKFKQTYEFIINLRNLDLKKPEEQIELWVQLPHDRGKPTKIGAFVGPELADQAKANCDLVILYDQFSRYAANKKEIKKLASSYEYFIAQINIMPDVAKTFGRFFGPRGKMPNPKAGCVVPPNTNLKVLAERLRKTIKLSAKLQPSIKAMVGKEDAPDEQIAENMMTIYTNVLHKLPQETYNIKSVLLKLTMSPPVKIKEKGIEKPVIPEAAPAKAPKKRKAKEASPKESSGKSPEKAGEA